MKLQVTKTLAADELNAIDEGSRRMPDGRSIPEYEPLCVALRDHYQTLVGGALGNTGQSWCYVRSLWVADGMRKLGWGSQLLAEMEAEARRRGCRHVYLDTFSDQAAGFYIKNGYAQFAALEDFPGDRQRVFFRKDL